MKRSALLHRLRRGGGGLGGRTGSTGGLLGHLGALGKRSHRAEGFLKLLRGCGAGVALRVLLHAELAREALQLGIPLGTHRLRLRLRCRGRLGLRGGGGGGAGVHVRLGPVSCDVCQQRIIARLQLARRFRIRGPPLCPLSSLALQSLLKLADETLCGSELIGCGISTPCHIAIGGVRQSALKQMEMMVWPLKALGRSLCRRRAVSHARGAVAIRRRSWLHRHLVQLLLHLLRHLRSRLRPHLLSHLRLHLHPRLRPRLRPHLLLHLRPHLLRHLRLHLHPGLRPRLRPQPSRRLPIPLQLRQMRRDGLSERSGRFLLGTRTLRTRLQQRRLQIVPRQLVIIGESLREGGRLARLRQQRLPALLLLEKGDALRHRPLL